MANNEQRGGPEPIASERVDGTRKTFFLDMLENGGGRFVRLKERTSGGSSFVMIPLEHLREVGELLQRLADWSAKNP